MEPEPNRKTFVIKSPPPVPASSVVPSGEPKRAASDPRRKHFQIKSLAPKYELPHRPHVSPTVFVGLDADPAPNANRQFRLYFTAHSFQQVEEHIGWGHHTADNGVEQGGILLGESYRDSKQDLIYVVIRKAISGRKARGSAAYLAMTHETWAEMLSQVDEIVDADPESKLRIVGWYHTHPNSLDVFMSGTDQNTQRNFFPHEWQFAVVLNPHKKLWRVYHGAESEQCAGFVLEKRGEQSVTNPDSRSEENSTASPQARLDVGKQIMPCLVQSEASGPSDGARPRKRGGFATVGLVLYSLAVTAWAIWLWYQGASGNANESHELTHDTVMPASPPKLSQEDRSRLELVRAVLADWKTDSIKTREQEQSILDDLQTSVAQVLSVGASKGNATPSPNAESAEVSERMGGEPKIEPDKAAKQEPAPPPAKTDLDISDD